VHYPDTENKICQIPDSFYYYPSDAFNQAFLGIWGSQRERDLEQKWYPAHRRPYIRQKLGGHIERMANRCIRTAAWKRRVVLIWQYEGVRDEFKQKSDRYRDAEYGQG
jgi:hypothetical protein